MYKTIIALITLFCLSSFQPKDNSVSVVQEQLSFCYVDNSKLGVGDGLNEGILTELRAQIDRLKLVQKEDQSFLMYVSDGLEPQIETNRNEATKLIELLSERFYSAPNIVADQKKIKSLLSKKGINVTDLIEFNYYVTNSLAEKIVSDQPEMVGNLLSEINFLNSTEAKKIHFNLHYPKVKGQAKGLKTDIIKSLSILENGLNIQIKVTEYK